MERVELGERCKSSWCRLGKAHCRLGKIQCLYSRRRMSLSPNVPPTATMASLGCSIAILIPLLLWGPGTLGLDCQKNVLIHRMPFQEKIIYCRQVSGTRFLSDWFKSVWNLGSKILNIIIFTRPGMILTKTTKFLKIWNFWKFQFSL